MTKPNAYCVPCGTAPMGSYEEYTGADCGEHDDEPPPPEPELGFCIWCNAEDVLDANDMCRGCRKLDEAGA